MVSATPQLIPRASDLVHLDWLRNTGIADLNGLRILDLGCGSGFLLDYAVSMGATTAVGVDMVKLPAHPLITWLDGDLDKDDWYHKLEHQAFDLIFAFDILEHLKGPVFFLEKCQKLLIPGGRLFLSTPNVLSLERWLHPQSWSGVQDEQHRILLSRYSLYFLLRRVGFDVFFVDAPLRSLKKFPRWLQLPLGGQMFALARKQS